MTTQCYFTPVPSRRISTNGQVEFRLAADGCRCVHVAAVWQSGHRIEVGTYSLKPNLELVKVIPNTAGFVGQFEWELGFENEQGEIVDMTEETQITQADTPESADFHIPEEE